jgi:hypothetical protein
MTLIGNLLMGGGLVDLATAQPASEKIEIQNGETSWKK